MTVDKVIVHHQGAGNPNDAMRFLNEANYSAGIGVSIFVNRRPPEDSFVTNGQNGARSYQLCLSGNRMDHRVTNGDLLLIGRCVAEARRFRWVTDRPDVFFHSDTDGTVCPGTFTEARRAEVVAACQAPAVAHPWPTEWSTDMPAPKDVVNIHKNDKGAWRLYADGSVATITGTFYGSYFDIPEAGRQGERYFVDMTDRLDGLDGYTLWSNDSIIGYSFPLT